MKAVSCKNASKYVCLCRFQLCFVIVPFCAMLLFLFFTEKHTIITLPSAYTHVRKTSIMCTGPAHKAARVRYSHSTHSCYVTCLTYYIFVAPFLSTSGYLATICVHCTHLSCCRSFSFCGLFYLSLLLLFFSSIASSFDITDNHFVLLHAVRAVTL